MKSKHQTLKTILELMSYLFLSWLGMWLYHSLEFSLFDIFVLDKFLEIIQTKILPLVLLLVVFAIANALLFIALRHFPRKKALMLAFVFGLLAILPGFFLFITEAILYRFTFLFYLIGLLYITLLIVDEKEENFHHSFYIGWHYLRVLMLITAIGAGIGTFMLLQSHEQVYEDSLTSIIQSLAKENTFHLSKDQIKTMLQAQWQQPNVFALTKDDFKDLVDSLYTPLTVDEYIALVYPHFDQLPKDQQQLLKQQLQEALNSPEYLQNLEKVKQEKIERMYQLYQAQLQGSLPNLDAMVDQIYQQIQTKNYQKTMTEVSLDVIKQMPLFQTIFSLFPALMALTVFSFLMLVELLASFIGGLIFIWHYFAYKKKHDTWF